MKKHGIIVLALFTGLMFLSTIVPLIVSATPKTPKDGTEIIITAIIGSKYDKKSIDLQKATEYEIIFWNNESDWHNLVIATDGRVVTADDTTPKTGDLLLGPRDSVEANETNKGGTNTSVWDDHYTTPNEDKFVMFYCSFDGHFEAGLWGYFKVGNPTGNPPGTPAPGFELAIGLLIIAGLAIFQRRRK